MVEDGRLYDPVAFPRGKQFPGTHFMYCHDLERLEDVWIGEWIYWPLIHPSWNYKKLQRYH
jgi:hypothetical protein